MCELTKLEYFAGRAMQGMLANSYGGKLFQSLSERTGTAIAGLAVKQANRLLEELDRSEDAGRDG